MSAEWSDEVELRREVGKLKESVAVMRSEMIPLKEGVANFREFQRRGTSYFDKAEARMEAEDERRAREEENWKKRTFWVKLLASILVPAILGIGGWLVIHWYNFTQDLIDIDNHWHQSKTFLDELDPKYTVHEPQDAGVPAHP